MKTTMQKAVFLASCITVAAPAFAGAAEQNQVRNPGYQMAAITDRAYGDSILSGDYSKAIERLSGRSDRFETSTNLCVAYTLSGELENAESACATALAISERHAREARTAYSTTERHDLAVALSNRGVVSAMRGDLKGALSSFSRAVELHDDFEQAENNLNRSMAAATAVMRKAGNEA